MVDSASHLRGIGQKKVKEWTANPGSHVEKMSTANQYDPYHDEKLRQDCQDELNPQKPNELFLNNSITAHLFP